MTIARPRPTVIATLAISLSVNTLAIADAKPGAWRGQSVTEFTPKDDLAADWQIVNDSVMGGLSEGRVDPTNDGTMRFSGTLSLENNGGFSMVRSDTVDLNLSNDLGLLMRVKGDGRTYEARLESSARFRSRPVSFAGEFSTKEGEWVQVKIPFSSFRGSFHGRDLPDATLDPSQISRLGILLADKQAGTFDLEIDWIRTYGKGKGKFLSRSTEGDSKKITSPSEKPKNLIDTLVADGRFNTLKTALDAAGLTVFFQWDNPLTVFAPTDKAFAKLPKGTLEELLKPENKGMLIAILSNHVAPGAYDLADALKTGQVEPVDGSSLSVTLSNRKVRINNASLIDADVRCSDGVIHVVDNIILPPDSN